MKNIFNKIKNLFSNRKDVELTREFIRVLKKIINDYDNGKTYRVKIFLNKYMRNILEKIVKELEKDL